MFEDVFAKIAGYPWEASLEPFKAVAEYRFKADSKGLPQPIPEDLHDVAITYYILYLVADRSWASGSSTSTAHSESLGDYSYSDSKSTSNSDSSSGNDWLSRYNQLLNSFRVNKYLGRVKLCDPHPYTYFDAARIGGGCCDNHN